MKIPFGKFKGKELVTFIHQDELKYLEWFLENCKETISKFPAFEKHLEENFDYEKYYLLIIFQTKKGGPFVRPPHPYSLFRMVMIP